MNEKRVGKYLVKIVNREIPKDMEYLYQSYRLRYEEMIMLYNHKSENEEKMDHDIYDEYCDHLVVVDTEIDKVIGSYRLILNKHIVSLNNKFLTEKEFNVDELKTENVLELGRAIVSINYRDGVVINALWKGVLQYALENSIKYMIGTASFIGVDPNEYIQSLSYLKNNYLIDKNIYAWHSVAKINYLSQGEVDDKKAIQELPPLIKGYIRLGAKIGKGEYIDYDFNSVDVLIILDFLNVNKKYLERYLRD